MTATAEKQALEFDVSNLFDDEQAAPADVGQEESPEQPEAETATEEIEDDGPQPGDDFEEEIEAATEEELGEALAADGVPADDQPTSLTHAENCLIEIQNAERRCIASKSEWDNYKELTKDAKKRYEADVDRLRALCRAAELDSNRPLLQESVPANPSRHDASSPVSEVSGADSFEPLEPGQILVRLLADISDEEGEDATLHGFKGQQAVCYMDGETMMLLVDSEDRADDLGLEKGEYEILKRHGDESTTESSDDERLDAPLSETAITPAMVEKLADAGLKTVRDLANFTSEKQLTDIKGIGTGKAEKIEAAMEVFWGGN